MPKENLKPIHSVEGKRRKIAWDREFREMLRENPGIIKTAMELADRAIAEYNPPNIVRTEGQGMELRYDKAKNQWLEMGTREQAFRFGRGSILAPGQPTIDETTGLEVTVLGRSNRENVGISFSRVDVCDYFRINFKDKSFFVKRSFVTTNPGFEEFHNALKAKEALRSLDFVKVIDAHLGFQDKNQSWYVSSWEELESAGFATWDALDVTGWGEHGQKIPRIYDDYPIKDETDREYEEIKEKVGIITGKLAKVGIIDVPANLFYNRKTKKFILIDPTNINVDAVIGTPIREIKKN